jgi:hypothetical protein
MEHSDPRSVMASVATGGLNMISRKTNIPRPEQQIPAFRAIAWIDQDDNRRVAFVPPDGDLEIFNRLTHHYVIIDSSKYFCIEVRMFTPTHGREEAVVGIFVRPSKLE